MIKTLTANQNPSCFKELKTAAWRRTISSNGVDAKIVIVIALGVNCL